MWGRHAFATYKDENPMKKPGSVAWFFTELLCNLSQISGEQKFRTQWNFRIALRTLVTGNKQYNMFSLQPTMITRL